MSRVTENQVKEAESVLYRHYRDWVDSEVEALTDAIFREEVEDYEGLVERMEQNTDDALIYTKDQHLVIFTSESTSEGQQEMEDLGGGGDNLIGVLALLTFRVDVRDAMERVGLTNDFDRVDWIKSVIGGEQGPELAVAWDKYLEGGGTPLEVEED